MDVWMALLALALAAGTYGFFRLIDAVRDAPR